MNDLILRDVEVDGRRVDVVVRTGRIEAVLSSGSASGSAPAGVGDVLDGGGGVLLPGLWDHHLHLLALAAALASVDVRDGVVGPLRRAAHDRADVTDRAARWIRAVGYHETSGGPLDAVALDALVPDRPVRVQHRSGAMWVLNTAAADLVDLRHADHPGVERDADGRVTGRVFGADAWLRDRIGTEAPDLAAVGRTLARLGVVGVTDMTPDEDERGWHLLADAARRGDLPQRVVVTGGPGLARSTPPAPLRSGPVKLYLADHALPSFDDVVRWVETARGAGRNVAFHSVTRASLALAVAALDHAGVEVGDRVEHGAVVPPELAASLAGLGLTVVTQPGFVADRGDDYLADVDPGDVPHLYPCRRLLGTGIPVGGSTDAPHGPVDPWLAIRAAVDRRTRAGAVLGAGERVAPAQALGLFLTPDDDPGGRPRRVAAGADADLCLLRVGLADALRAPDASLVAATIVAGRVVHEARTSPGPV